MRGHGFGQSTDKAVEKGERGDVKVGVVRGRNRGSRGHQATSHSPTAAPAVLDSAATPETDRGGYEEDGSEAVDDGDGEDDDDDDDEEEEEEEEEEECQEDGRGAEASGRALPLMVVAVMRPMDFRGAYQALPKALADCQRIATSFLPFDGLPAEVPPYPIPNPLNQVFNKKTKNLNIKDRTPMCCPLLLIWLR
jgi:hypothetical protein